MTAASAMLLPLLLAATSVPTPSSATVASVASAASAAASAVASTVAATAGGGGDDDDDCVLDLAFVCLDDRALVYVRWLDKRDKLNVVGDIVTIVRKQPASRADDRSKVQRHRVVSTSLAPAIDEYFDTHTLRISLPWILDDDIDLELDQEGKKKKHTTHGYTRSTCESQGAADREWSLNAFRDVENITFEKYAFTFIQYVLLSMQIVYDLIVDRFRLLRMR